MVHIEVCQKEKKKQKQNLTCFILSLLKQRIGWKGNKKRAKKLTTKTPKHFQMKKYIEKYN